MTNDRKHQCDVMFRYGLLATFRSCCAGFWKLQAANGGRQGGSGVGAPRNVRRLSDRTRRPSGRLIRRTEDWKWPTAESSLTHAKARVEPLVPVSIICVKVFNQARDAFKLRMSLLNDALGVGGEKVWSESTRDRPFRRIFTPAKLKIRKLDLEPPSRKERGGESVQICSKNGQ